MAETSTSYKGSASKMISSEYLFNTLSDLKDKYIDKRAASLSVSGKTVTLKDADGNVLSTITTQDTDTTYSAATTTKDGLMTKEMVTTLNNLNSIEFEATTLDLSGLV